MVVYQHLTTAWLESVTAVCGLIAYLPKEHSYIKKNNNPHIIYNYSFLILPCTFPNTSKWTDITLDMFVYGWYN